MPGGGGGGGARHSSQQGGDRDYGCFVWDVEHQSSASTATASSNSPVVTRRSKNTPLYKLSHLAGVASLGWILEGGGSPTLIVGGQQRHLQLYDLRASSASANPPITVHDAHTLGGVHGIAVDPSRPWHLATFSRAAGEAVKLWDARRMDAALAELKIWAGGGGDYQYNKAA